jgi:predicted phosphoadenosine phosphosulfate sulfurtransferase
MNGQLLGEIDISGMVINELYSYAEIYYLFYRVGVSFGVIRIRQV